MARRQATVFADIAAFFDFDTVKVWRVTGVGIDTRPLIVGSKRLQFARGRRRVAFGWQYALHPSHPFPVSQASKNFLAIPVIGVMNICFRGSATLSRLVAFRTVAR